MHIIRILQKNEAVQVHQARRQLLELEKGCLLFERKNQANVVVEKDEHGNPLKKHTPTASTTATTRRNRFL